MVTEEEAEKKMDIIGTISHRKTDGTEADGSGPVMVGIDIGTTTIAMELVDMDSGAEIDSYLCINRQRRYGADVISRNPGLRGRQKGRTAGKASGRTFLPAWKSLPGEEKLYRKKW